MNPRWRDSSTDAALAELRGPGAILVFGAGTAGAATLDACREAGVAVAAVCDNSPAKAGSRLRGAPVLPPGEAFRLYPGARIIVAVLRERHIEEALAQSRSLGASAIYGAHIAERFYRRRDDCSGYGGDGWKGWSLAQQCGAFHRAFSPDGDRVNVEAVSYLITDRCTLNCRDCSVFVPRFDHPRFYAFEEIVRDIDAFCTCVDAVPAFGVLGGEPLTHPDFHRIVGHAAAHPKIGRVVITTNGTVLPRGEQWEFLRHPKVYFVISSYGALSTNLDKLVERLEREGVKGEIIRDMSHWVVSALRPDGGPRPVEELRRTFASCAWNGCQVLAKGRLYRCGSMLNGVKLGRIPDLAEDSVDFSPAFQGKDIARLRRAIRSYLRDTTYLRACGYCFGAGPDREKAPAAVQAERRDGSA